MLSDNIKRIRKSKGLSQEELAIKLNVVRQTVSKWENGLSVPDSDMLITLADELDTSVNVLLGETVTESMTDLRVGLVALTGGGHHDHAPLRVREDDVDHLGQLLRVRERTAAEFAHLHVQKPL